MIMCVLLCYPVSIHMSQLLSTGRPICSYFFNWSNVVNIRVIRLCMKMKVFFNLHHSNAYNKKSNTVEALLSEHRRRMRILI